MVIYNSGDSQNLISALETNLSGAQQIFDRLSKGSQHLIGVLDSGTLSGAAYNAGKNLFVAYINPMLQKLNQAISDIQGDLRAYKSADSAVSRYGTHLDSDQIEHLLRLTNHMIQLLEDKIRADKDFINNFLSGGFEKVGGALAELPQLYEQLDNLKEIKATRENELRALEEFKYTTNSLFKDSAKAFDSAMKGVAIINQSSASADGTITFPAGADMSWFKKLSNEKLSSNLSGSKNKSKTDKLTEQQLEAFLKDGGKLMVYKDRARVKTANQNDLASDVSFADADVVIWYIVKDGVVIKLSEHPEFKDLSKYLQKKGGKLKKDQYTTISFNQAEKMLVDSMDGLAGNVARFEYYFRPVENALAGLVAVKTTEKAIQVTGRVPDGSKNSMKETKITSEFRINTKQLDKLIKEVPDGTSKLTPEQLRQFVKASDQNSNAKTVLLGGWKESPKYSYEQQAFAKKYSYYDMGDAYDKLDVKVPDVGRVVNVEWLDQKIAQGKNFVLSTDPKMAKNSYKLELNKLKNNGYVIPDKPGADGLYHVTKGGK